MQVLPTSRFDGHDVASRQEIIHPTRDDTPSEAAQDALWQILEMLEHSVALIGVYDANEFLRFTNQALRHAYFIEPGERLDWQDLMRRIGRSKEQTDAIKFSLDAAMLGLPGDGA